MRWKCLSYIAVFLNIYHFVFQKILVWLQKREVRLREFTPVGSDFDTIKVQWNQVKVWTSTVLYRCMFYNLLD